MLKKILLLCCGVLVALGSGRVGATEPQIADYTSLPVFTVNPVKPNILILLDNSGSMNFNAYGTYPGDGGVVADAPYQGAPYYSGVTVVTAYVQASTDDSEQDGNGDSWYSGSDDLDMGRFGLDTSTTDESSIVGVRFAGLAIPKGATITNAYIQFTVNKVPDPTLNYDAPISLKIVGEDTGDALSFNGSFDDLSGRPETKQKVFWGSNTAYSTDPWSPVNANKRTPNLQDIVQEIVDRDDWKSGNAMAFLINYQANSTTAKRDANSYEDAPTDLTLHPLLHVEYTSTAPKEYYGYFNPDWFYSYASNKFSHAYEKVGYNTSICPNEWEVIPKANVDDGSNTSICLANTDIVSQGLWDGNWANWAAMRRIDVARKVLMGGLATSRTGGGNQTVFGETPAQSSRVYIKDFDSSISAVSPYDGDYSYTFKGGYMEVDNKKYTLAISENEAYEPQDFYQGNVAGVLQRVGDKAYWGDEFFEDGYSTEGGYISNPIGTNMNTLITDLQNTGADTWTPLAESYYVAMQYFKQQKPASGLGYSNSAIGATNNQHDPYYHDGQFVPCAKSFVLLVTDGASTMDSILPSAYKVDTDGDENLDLDNGPLVDDPNCNEKDYPSGADNCDYPDYGTDFLDDLALTARTTDLRPDLDGDQNLILYPVYAFGNDPNAEKLLENAAKNGGFNDLNGNNLPDLQAEWDANGDGIPDNFFEAQDGYTLEAKITEAINDILRRAASGTAVSVLATSSAGEGTLVQAYFQPDLTTGLAETKWVGYLQSLWVDAKGNLREDTNQNHTLDLGADKIITYDVDSSGNTVVYKFDVSPTDEYPDTDPATNTTGFEKVSMSDIQPIWEAGKVLQDRVHSGDTRQIFTAPLGGGTSLDGGTAFQIDGTTENYIAPYLGVEDDTTWSYLGSTKADRVNNLINYVRGHDPGSGYMVDVANTNMRMRTVNGETWPLGDIVDSTPVAVSLPPENFGLIYSDASYDAYYNFQKNNPDRETVVYVGANDGMLHAFAGWRYNATTKQFSPPQDYPDEPLGSELWAYLPEALLPQLKWLPDPDYGHTYYVDLTPKVTDARIFDVNGDGVIDDSDTDASHVDGWGTILIGGMRFGGKPISVTDDFDHDPSTPDTTQTFESSYFAIDVSDPHHPKFMWEKTYPGLGFTTSEPAVIKVGDKWYAVFGSGPTTYDGTSDQPGQVFVVDLKTGDLVRSFDTSQVDTSVTQSFMSGAASLDKDLNYNVDAVYLGQSYETSSKNWLGALYKVAVPWFCTDSSGNDCSAGVDYGTLVSPSAGCTCTYEDDPNNFTHPWQLEKVFSSPAPITAAPALSVDNSGNAWIYFGTGRYLSTSDKTTTDPEYLFGIKDPFFNPDHQTDKLYEDDYYHNYADSLTLDTTTATPYSSTSGAAKDNPLYLFDADDYDVVFPWSCEAYPQGDCSTVPSGSVGDVNGDGSCTCSYAWPTYVCASTDPSTTTDAAACGGVTGITSEAGPNGSTIYVNSQSGYYNNGLCQCLAYQVPTWGSEDTVAGSGACSGSTIKLGQVGDVNGCTGFYWKDQGQTDQSCLGIAFGASSGTYTGPDGTACTVTKMTSVPFAWSCAARPAGTCSGVTPGSVGDVSASQDGSAWGTYWNCYDPSGGNGCSTLDATSTDYSYYAGFSNPSGSCYCQESSTPAGLVQNTTANTAMTFSDLVDMAKNYDGWMRSLTDPGERSVAKPSLLGGITLFTSYIPSADLCAFGGSSDLYALYYETGTAYQSPVIGTHLVLGEIENKYRTSLGLGMASSIGIHVGLQPGNQATGFIQQSTGAIKDVSLNPALTIRSGLTWWKEK